MLSKVFEIERAHLHPGESEERFRQDELKELLRNWAENHPKGEKR